LNLENFVLAHTEVPSHLEVLSAENKDAWRDMFGHVDDLDKPFFLTQDNRHDLPPVSDETHGKLEEAGFPDSVIESIGTDAEANIYLDAELEAEQINGKDALIRTDIDCDQKDIFGETNLERMEQGRAPLDAHGRPIELHHIGQKRDSPLAELTRAEHREGGNDNVLHNKQKESEINREDFAKERQEYWKARAEQIKSQP
jgi:hypothetical protein